MDSSTSDLDHWRISATVYKDRVEEVRYHTDPARGIRRQKYTKVWQVDELLGRGGFGEVRLEKSVISSDNDDPEMRAVKRIPVVGKSWSDKECQKELEALLEFSKPKFKEAAVFVDFFGWFKDGSDIFLAMEYLPLGDLEKNVMACSGKVPESEAREITEQVLGALQFMHAESFAHRDLKPQNILVVRGPPTWWVKIADFGLSKRLTGNTAYRTVGGTQDYMAPEILEPGSKGIYTNAVDIWSVGCIVYRIVTGHPPFSFRSLGPYCMDKTLFPFDPLINCRIGTTASLLIQELLAARPSDRPSASLALGRAWIRQESDVKHRNNTQDRSPFDYSSPISNAPVSEMTFDTATHEGLKSYSLPPISRVAPSSYRTSTKSPTPNIGTAFAYNTVASPFTEDHGGRPLPPLAQQETPVPYEVQPTQGGSLDDHRRSLEGHTDSILSAAFSPDGKSLASVSRNMTFQLWDVREAVSTYKVELRLEEGDLIPIAAVAAFSFSKTPTQLAIEIWCERGDPYIGTYDTLTGIRKGSLRYKRAVQYMAYFPNGSILVSVGSNLSVLFWDPDHSTLLKSIETTRGYFPRFHYTLDRIEVYLEPHKPTSGQSWVATHSGDLSAIAIYSRMIKIWNHTAEHEVARFIRGSGQFTHLAFSLDGKWLISGAMTGYIKIWDIHTGLCQGGLCHPSGGVSWLGFSPDGRVLASASTVGEFVLWDFEYLKKNLPVESETIEGEYIRRSIS